MRRVLFALFFLSGFSGLVYQVIWTRIAFASFGIILPVLSIVISVFMLGLSAGAWLAGRLVPSLQRTRASAALYYAGTEVFIGLGAFAVPALFHVGEGLLLGAGQSNSTAYLWLSAIILTLSIFPWSLAMGATFPLMMAYVRERESGNQESFSFLYLANVIGAMSGTLLSALVLIELFGFRRTLAVAAASNWTVALISGYLGWRQGQRRTLSQKTTGDDVATPVTAAPSEFQASPQPFPAGKSRLINWLLFSTGFSAMAMEVVWARAFTPVLRTQVYSFAAILFCYLAATCSGSWLYRRNLRQGKVHSTALLVSLLTIAALLPVLIDDFRILPREWRGPMDPKSAMMLLASIGPLCAILGYLTPSLIDAQGQGDPRRAGKAYALNVLGCILGPLFASYVLLPRISERYALILLALPFFVFGWMQLKSSPGRRWTFVTVSIAALFVAAFVTEDFQGRVLRLGKHAEVRRDHAAFVVSVGEARDKLLMVNGMDMTVLSPVTKYMVHLPLALHTNSPKSVLIICFGMGTTHRSALSWGVETTTVELIPSVKEAFGFYHADAPQVVQNPKGSIVIDDGRRFLNRSHEQYDAIVIDPPPPVMAAGSSLLYSTEFYASAKKHLKPDGILETWVPKRNIEFAPPIIRSLSDAFSYTRCFDALENGGYHLLASDHPIEIPSVDEFIARTTALAQQDLLEWSASHDLRADVNEVLSHELPVAGLLDPNPRIRITDDQPYNEYFMMRSLLRRQGAVRLSRSY